ncbi:MAG: TldD/PmbA family protein [Chloroflexi bacterium]|nr:TldD/PmbA family protein [Chloroflexota bacterium]MCL5074741.1 TldD/PmbA family protein [Chloroflexota bacterium]
MHLESLNSFLPELITEIEQSVPYAAALATAISGVNIFVDNHEQRVTQRDPTKGIVLTVYNGRYFQEYATTTLDKDALWREARGWAKGLTRFDDGPPLAPASSLNHHYVSPIETDPASVALSEKFAFVVAYQARAREVDPCLINAQVSYREAAEEKVFADRTRLLSQVLSRTLLSTMLFVSDGVRTEYDWRVTGGTVGYEITRGQEDKIGELKESALALLSAERIEPGLYEVIASPDVAGLIAHESFGHGVELDMFLKGRARAREYIGKMVASPLVDMFDDPTLAGAYGTYHFDDEGQLASPTQIIRAGILERGISDLHSALVLGVPPTGNGRRESFARKAYARMSNTYFASAQSKVEEMIRSIDKGVYLCRAHSGMEDPKDWGIQLVVHYGREIVNGQLTGRVFSPIVVSGYVPDMLQSISAVGDDCTLSSGLCGKGHKEYVPVSSGGPHLRLKVRLG